MNFTKEYIKEVSAVVRKIDTKKIDKIVNIICNVRKNNVRIFFLGVGGSAANASHAVNDFRKLCGLECYSPTDNVSELTARTNDEGWETVFENWLRTSRLKSRDLIFIFSVGGGSLEKGISVNLVNAIKLAKSKKSKICGITGSDGGYTAKQANACLNIPINNKKNLTPHSEAFQAVIWHLLVSHPKLKRYKTKW